VGLIPGSEHPEEVVILNAHWDHLGTNPRLNGDQIFNGAVDNATGIAGMIALAEEFMRGSPPKRSLLFLSVTAEEEGRLGSEFYAQNPLYDLNKTVAAINIDALGKFGAMRDVKVVGFGQSEMDDYLARAAAEQGRYLVPDPSPEKGFFYRADQLSYAKVGVPAIYAKGGTDSRTYGKTWGEQQAAADTTYHAVSDEYNPDWDLTGAVEDLQLYFRVVEQLLEATSFPKWNENSEFRSVRVPPRD